jgi:chitin disaccharide deacetylase
MTNQIVSVPSKSESEYIVPSSKGALIINADDWGRDRENTDCIHDCIRGGTVSSVSAMVFMEDSQRAADLALEHGIDAGLHLNLTSGLTGCSPQLAGAQGKIARHLLKHRLSQVIYHPGLVRAFEFVVKAQLDEFQRLFGGSPKRIDGHHHMHLCTNMLVADLLPRGVIVRRNFSFERGEKGFHNRLYRKLVDRVLGRRYRIADFLFSLAPIDLTRLPRIASLAENQIVELETHPVKPAEHKFLAGGEIFRHLGSVRIASGYSVPAITTSSREGLTS